MMISSQSSESLDQRSAGLPQDIASGSPPQHRLSAGEIALRATDAHTPPKLPCHVGDRHPTRATGRAMGMRSTLSHLQRCPRGRQPAEQSLRPAGRHQSSATKSGALRQALFCMASKESSAVEVDQSLNSRVAALKPSKTVALTDLALSLREQGVDVIGLAAGEPDFDTPASVAEAGRQAISDGVTRYSPNVGTSELRTAICRKLKEENGLEYAPSEVVLSNGAKQSIWQCVLACCGEGDEVIVPAPYWVSYVEMVRLAGATPVVVETTPEEGYMLTPEKLKAAMTPKSRLIILCSPSNPTGAVYSREGLEALAEVVGQHPRLLVMSDEIYEHIIYPPAKHHSFGTLPGMFERTLTVNGFSKAFAMCGWRLGYVAAPQHFAKACSIIQSQCTSGPSSIAQKAGLAALQLGPGGGEAVEAMLTQYQSRRDYVIERLTAMEGVKIAAPQGAFYVLPDVSHFFGPGVAAEGFGEVPDGDTLCRYLIEEAKVALVPGDAFGAPNCLRISYAASMETIVTAMDRIAEALEPSKFHRA